MIKTFECDNCKLNAIVFSNQKQESMKCEKCGKEMYEIENPIAPIMIMEALAGESGAPHELIEKLLEASKDLLKPERNPYKSSLLKFAMIKNHKNNTFDCDTLGIVMQLIEDNEFQFDLADGLLKDLNILLDLFKKYFPSPKNAETVADLEMFHEIMIRINGVTKAREKDIKENLNAT